MSMFYQPPKRGRPPRDAGKMDQRDIELRYHYNNWAPRNARPGKVDAYEFARWYLQHIKQQKKINESDVDRVRKRIERALKRTKIRVLHIP